MNEEEVYLRSILEIISRLEFYLKIGYEEYLKDQIRQDAVRMQLIDLGEAVKHVTPISRQKRPEIPWTKIAGTRDVLTHDYLKADLELIWVIASRDLQPLKAAIEDILAWS